MTSILSIARYGRMCSFHVLGGVFELVGIVERNELQRDGERVFGAGLPLSTNRPVAVAGVVAGWPSRALEQHGAVVGIRNWAALVGSKSTWKITFLPAVSPGDVDLQRLHVNRHADDRHARVGIHRCLMSPVDPSVASSPEPKAYSLLLILSVNSVSGAIESELFVIIRRVFAGADPQVGIVARLIVLNVVVLRRRDVAIALHVERVQTHGAG